jgi:hypothetical protein
MNKMTCKPSRNGFGNKCSFIKRALKDQRHLSAISNDHPPRKESQAVALGSLEKEWDDHVSFCPTSGLRSFTQTQLKNEFWKFYKFIFM